MCANYKAELVGAFGQPISENPTGVMIEKAFATLGLNWRYLMLEVDQAHLVPAFEGAKAFGMRGFNLTIPHKVSIMQYLDDVAPEARIIGAVNTVRQEGARWIGENTDGKGFMRGLTVDAQTNPQGKKVVILGAGGAARAVATELALAGIAELCLVNRTPARVEAVVKDLQTNTPVSVTYQLWEGTYTVPHDVDLFVNATSIGLYPHVDEMPNIDLSHAKKELLVCDVVFNPAETKLLRYARSLGLATLDGLSMLVYQAALAFEMWSGEKAPEEVMKEALQQALADS